jgi:hypothetical protein
MMARILDAVDGGGSVERRDFLKALGMAGSIAALGCQHGEAHAAAEATPAPTAPPVQGTESGKAWSELLALLAEADARYLGKEWNIARPGDIADGHRFLMHVLHSGMEQWLEADPTHPRAVRFVTPTLKLLGDNPDAIYYTAPLDPKRRYRVRANTGGAVYTSLTIEGGNSEGHYPKRVAGALNDTQFDVKKDGSFEVVLGPAEKGRNRLALEPDAGTLTTRHYFETVKSIAADPYPPVRLLVEPIEDPGPPPTPSDASIAAGIRRVANYFRAATLDMPPMDPVKQPPWVSRVPNSFNAPTKWQSAEGGFGAVDNAYSMAPYLVMPDQALVIEGRWPKARFANVVLWNRFMQTYDYAHRRVSLNRKQTKLERDGSFRIVIAHSDPGVPNWIDAEGRISGLVFWRFQLPEGDVKTPVGKLVPLASLRMA